MIDWQMKGILCITIFKMIIDNKHIDYILSIGGIIMLIIWLFCVFALFKIIQSGGCNKYGPYLQEKDPIESNPGPVL
jgi:hypothetical protein